jgi:hypothetical protein
MGGGEVAWLSSHSVRCSASAARMFTDVVMMMC